MDTPYVLARNFLKGSRYDGLAKYLAEHVGIVDVLRSLPDTENGYLFRQVRSGKQGIPTLVCGNRHTEIIIFLRIQISGFLISLVYAVAPRDHIVGIVVEQFHLRSKLRDIVSRTRSCFQQLIFYAAEAIKARLGRCSRCVGDLVALVKDQLYLFVVNPYPPLDLLLILSQSIQRDDYEIALLDTVKVGKLFNEHVGKSVIFQNDIPVVTNGDCRGYYPSVMHVLILHTVETNGNSGKRLTAALLPLKQSVSLLKHQIDILLLLFVKMYFFLVLRIP